MECRVQPYKGIMKFDTEHSLVLPSSKFYSVTPETLFDFRDFPQLLNISVKRNDSEEDGSKIGSVKGVPISEFKD